MDKLKKCGEMYIKFNKNNEPEYGFIVEENEVVKLINLSDNVPEKIVLPLLAKKEKYKKPTIDLNKQESIYQRKYLRKYILGHTILRENCFKNIKKLEIVMPYENSVAFDTNTFSHNAEVTFVVPENIVLKQVRCSFHDGYGVQYAEWFVLVDKDFDCGFEYASERFSIHECDERLLNNNFTIKHEKFEDFEKVQE